jgi:hypothetical protein
VITLNRSVVHHTVRLQPLIDFVTRCVPDVARTEFVFEDLSDPTRHTGGLTECRGNAAIVVTIGLSRAWGLRYPYVDRHSVKEVDEMAGGTVFSSWDEEVVFTMLHEARHVRQFQRGTFNRWQMVDSEIDAEAFAKRMLRRYRKECGRKAGRRTCWVKSPTFVQGAFA